MKKAVRLLVATGIGASSFVAPVILTATPAHAVGYTYVVETPAPEAGAGCTRYTKFGVDTEKPGLPVVLTVYVECS